MRASCVNSMPRSRGSWWAATQSGCRSPLMGEARSRCRSSAAGGSASTRAPPSAPTTGRASGTRSPSSAPLRNLGWPRPSGGGYSSGGSCRCSEGTGRRTTSEPGATRWPTLEPCRRGGSTSTRCALCLSKAPRAPGATLRSRGTSSMATSWTYAAPRLTCSAGPATGCR